MKWGEVMSENTVVNKLTVEELENLIELLEHRNLQHINTVTFYEVHNKELLIGGIDKSGHKECLDKAKESYRKNLVTIEKLEGELDVKNRRTDA